MDTAIITGTGNGIGKAIAVLLLKQGYFVYGISRTNDIDNTNFKHLEIDLSNVQKLKDIQLPKAKGNKIILINNAATIGKISPLNLKSDVNIINEYNINIIDCIGKMKVSQSYHIIYIVNPYWICSISHNNSRSVERLINRSL